MSSSRLGGGDFSPALPTRGTSVRASVLLLMAVNLHAVIQSGGASTSNGVWVQYEMRLEPPSPPLAHFGGGVATSKDIIHRQINDRANKTYFGYDLVTEVLPDGRYRLTFAPLTLTPARMERMHPDIKGWSVLPLPSQPASQIVRAGETVALDLFINPSTGQKLVDYISVKAPSAREAVTVQGPARDFTPADAEIELSEPRLSINGQPFRGTENYRGSISGPAVWIDIDGHGRFVFSLAPRPDLGLHRAGEIRGTTMTWRSGANTYTMTTDKPIASGSAAYNVYVFHDPGYRPPGFQKLDPGRMGMSAGPRPDSAFRPK